MVLPRNMYMGDILHSEEAVEEAVRLREDLSNVLGGAGFRAQKWTGVVIEQRSYKKSHKMIEQVE